MENKKGIIIVILIIIILGLGGYIVYDKFLNQTEEEHITVINDKGINLNSMYQIGDILNKFDKTFNEVSSTYFGTIYNSKKIEAEKMNLDTAIFISMIDEMQNTQTATIIPEMIVKRNFETIFGENLEYKNTEIKVGNNYNIIYDPNTKNYAYTANKPLNNYKPGYYSYNMKTVMKNENVIVTRKIFYVEYVKNGEQATKAIIYKDSSKNQKVTEISIKNGDINTKELLAKYSSKLNTYEYTFKENKANNYIFEKIEKIK